MRPIPSAPHARIHSHPAAAEGGPPDSGPPRAAVSQSRYARQAAWITIGGFSLPTIVAPCFRNVRWPRVCALRTAQWPPAYAMRTLLAGMIYVDMIQPPMGVRFSPPPTRLQEVAALTLGMMPYLPAFTLQAHLTNTWCARQGSRGERMAAASLRRWRLLCERLPRRQADAARAYPINFVLARVTAQMAAVGAGSTLSAGWHRYRGATLEAIPQPPRPPSLSERIQACPQAYVAGMLAFAWPTVMTGRLDESIRQAGGTMRPAGVARLVGAVIAACIVTAMIHDTQ